MGYSEKCKVKVSMVFYLMKISKELAGSIVVDSPTQASDHIINIRNYKVIRLLGKERVIAYHKFVASFLFDTTIYRH